MLVAKITYCVPLVRNISVYCFTY